MVAEKAKSTESLALPPGRPGGFTLVELLVVIGIIALLVAILLPSLNVARQAAQRTSCAAKLHSIMIAAQIHVYDHHGFYPLAGLLDKLQPDAFSDGGISHYDYFSYTEINGPNVLAPITMALATEMSYRNVLNVTDNPTQDSAETDPHGFIRHFLCPSQATTVSDLYTTPMLYSGTFPPGWYVWYIEAQSYIYNEAIVGYDDAFARLRGRAGGVRQASATMFAADGLGGSNTNLRKSSFAIYPNGLSMATVYNNTPNPPVTLADALTGRRVNGSTLAGDPENFDKLRHRGKMNIAFCDGHVETRDISAKDLTSVYIMAP